MTLATTRAGHSRPGRLRSTARGTPVASHKLELPSVEWGNGMQKLATRNTATINKGGKANGRNFNSDRLKCLTPVSVLLATQFQEPLRPQPNCIHHAQHRT